MKTMDTVKFMGVFLLKVQRGWFRKHHNRPCDQSFCNACSQSFFRMFQVSIIRISTYFLDLIPKSYDEDR